MDIYGYIMSVLHMYIYIMSGAHSTVIYTYTVFSSYIISNKNNFILD